jgi:NAD(P)-dependent dehydrogenase (short-subunit alcohol dehydrogenase family)
VAFHTTRLALPGMVENKWGRIVNVASAHGRPGLLLKQCRCDIRTMRMMNTRYRRDCGIGPHAEKC